MTRDEWVEAFARELGLDTPTEEQIESILKLAATAAHASERAAAPIACWLGGMSGRSPAELNQVAERIGD